MIQVLAVVEDPDNPVAICKEVCSHRSWKRQPSYRCRQVRLDRFNAVKVGYRMVAMPPKPVLPEGEITVGTRMVNFRARDELYHAMKERADQAGMDLSRFIRSSMEQTIEGTTRTVLASKVGEAPGAASPVVAESDEPTERVDASTCLHPKAQVRKTPWGVKICEACGLKIA